MPAFDGDELNRLLLENLRDYAVFMLDTAGRVRQWNEGAQRLFGYVEGEIAGKSIARLYQPLDNESRTARQCLGVAAAQGRCEDEAWWVRKDHGHFQGQALFIALLDDRQRRRGYAVIARDTSMRAQALEDRATMAVTYYHAPIGIARVAIGGPGQFLDVNDKFCEIVGYSREELLRSNVARLTDPADWASERKLVARLAADEIESYSIEKRYQHARGGWIWVRVTSSKAGRFVGRPYRITIVEDISAWKKSEAALRHSEQRVRAILETAVDAIITITAHGIIRSANPATEHLFGYREEELIGRNVRMLMPQPYQHEHDGYIQRYLKTGSAKIIGIGREVIGLRKDRSTFPLSLSVSEIHTDEGRLFTGIIHDLTNRRSLERQILEAASNEQRRIGQDLHDGLCQDLIGIAFAVDAVARRLPAGSGASTTLDTLAGSVRKAAGQARDFAHGLNPVDVRAGGFNVALENLAATVSRSFGIKCSYKADPAVRVRDDTTATHLYRIVQEAIGNAIRHGKATEVRVEITGHDSPLTLSIADNGVGLSRVAGSNVRKKLMALQTGSSKSEAARAGIGLQTMNYRARVIGGTFEISDRKGAGLVVTCRIG